MKVVLDTNVLISGKARIIISGDRHLLGVDGCMGIHAMRPASFVRQYL